MGWGGGPGAHRCVCRTLPEAESPGEKGSPFRSSLGPLKVKVSAWYCLVVNAAQLTSLHTRDSRPGADPCAGSGENVVILLPFVAFLFLVALQQVDRFPFEVRVKSFLPKQIEVKTGFK